MPRVSTLASEFQERNQSREGLERLLFVTQISKVL
jgi:hypothetical protein